MSDVAPADGDAPGPPTPLQRAMREAMDRLARRSWARGELLEALVRRGIEPGIAEAAVNRCVERGWLDETAAARERAERLRRRGPTSPAAIARDLEGRRIDPSVAARIAAEVIPDARAAAVAAVERELRRISDRHAAAGDLPPADRRRIAGRLGRRGFEPEVLAAAMRECGIPVDDPGLEEMPGEDWTD